MSLDGTSLSRRNVLKSVGAGAGAATLPGLAAADPQDKVEVNVGFANDAGLDVFTSASIMQGRLATEMPGEVEARLDGDTPAQRAINFARSAPGVTSSLVGTGSPEHVSENVVAGTFEPLGADAFDAVFE